MIIHMPMSLEDSIQALHVQLVKAEVKDCMTEAAVTFSSS